MLKELNKKDLVIIGIFSVISMIVSFVASSITMVSVTFAMYAGSAFGALLVGPVYLILLKKVPKRGTVFLYYTIQGILYALMGMWIMLIIVVPLAIILEIIMIVTSYHKRFWIDFNYVIGQAIYALHGAFMLYLFGEQYIRDNFTDMMGDEGIDLMVRFYYKPIMVIIILGITAALAYLGTLLGHHFIKKHIDEKDEELS